MSAEMPEFCFLDKNALRAHAHIVGSVGSGKQNWLVASLALHALVSTAERAKNPHQAVPGCLLIDEFRPVSPPPGPEDDDRPR